MKFHKHYHEKFPAQFQKQLRRWDSADHQIDVWNAFAESNLTGINEDDCAIVPRLLPLSYLATIQKTARELTLFALRLLSLPEKEIRAIIPPGPIRDFLIEDLGVLRFRPERIVGSFRFDMAIVGPASKKNPPKLLELNEIGFDGLARSSFIQECLLNLLPDLRRKVLCLDTARAEVRNMARLGTKLSRFQYDSYNWEEEVLVQKAQQHGLNIELISPTQFKAEIYEEDEPLLRKVPVTIKNSRICVGTKQYPDAIQMGYSFELSDYKTDRNLYKSLVHSKTPQYGPFLTGLVASKIILVLLSDPSLRRKLLGTARSLENVILPAYSLEGREKETQANYKNCVLKHIDGLGGEMVFMNKNLVSRAKRIPKKESNHWIVQEKTYLNTIDVHGILSRPRKVISDLGVFVQYDWSRGKFNNFELGGFITRATNRSYCVNVSGGGIQVPVMFLRNK